MTNRKLEILYAKERILRDKIQIEENKIKAELANKKELNSPASSIKCHSSHFNCH